MKKIISFIAAAVSCAAVISSSAVFAESETYIPQFRFSPDAEGGAVMLTDNIVNIPSSVLAEGDYTLNTDIFIEDNKKSICYAVSAKWTSDSEYVLLTDQYLPTDQSGTLMKYKTSDGREFYTDMTPFAYGEINGKSEMVINGGYSVYHHPERNSMAATYTMTSNPNPFKTLGATSDEYAFASFDAKILKNTPSGVYKIYFNIPENTEGDGSLQSNFVYYSEDVDIMPVLYPRTSDLTIVVGDWLLGDTNMNGKVDSVDASAVLSAYANTATGKPSGLSEFSEFVSDVNKDGLVNSKDASAILAYYAFISTGGSGTIEEFLA